MLPPSGLSPTSKNESTPYDVNFSYCLFLGMNVWRYSRNQEQELWSSILIMLMRQFVCFLYNKNCSSSAGEPYPKLHDLYCYLWFLRRIIHTTPRFLTRGLWLFVSNKFWCQRYKIILITIQFVSIFFFLANYSRIPVIQCYFPAKYVCLVFPPNNKHQTVFAVYGEIGCTFFLRICLFQRIQIFDSCKLLKLLFLFSENKITGTEWEVNGQNINADLPVREVSVIWKHFLSQNF